PHRVSQCNDSHHLDPRHHHYLRHLLFFLMTPPPPSSTLFPYTTLFRSMLESFAQQAAPEIKERIAKVNLLLPGLTDEQLANCQRSEEHTSELQSPYDLVCRLLLEKKKATTMTYSLPTPAPLAETRGGPR